MSLVKGLRRWLQRFAGLFRRSQRDAEFAAELESHLQLHIEDNFGAGMTPEAARRELSGPSLGRAMQETAVSRSRSILRCRKGRNKTHWFAGRIPVISPRLEFRFCVGKPSMQKPV